MRADLHARPRVADSLSYLYVERCRVEQEARAIVVIDAAGRVPVPCSSLLVLLLGPGATITHAAIGNLADCGCTVGWVGEDRVRFYATGLGAMRSARNLLRQARLAVHAPSRLLVVRRMYELRFAEPLAEDLSLRQIRGREGVRVRDVYARESACTGIPWFERSYKRSDWRRADPVNRALSAANACLYGVVDAAIVATGYSLAIGFIHVGKQRSFVYDIADLYKTEVSIPVAFDVVRDGEADVESAVRKGLRARFVEVRLLDRIVSDIDAALGQDLTPPDMIDLDADAPGSLWGPGGRASRRRELAGGAGSRVIVVPIVERVPPETARRPVELDARAEGRRVRRAGDRAGSRTAVGPRSRAVRDGACLMISEEVRGEQKFSFRERGDRTRELIWRGQTGRDMESARKPCICEAILVQGRRLEAQWKRWPDHDASRTLPAARPCPKGSRPNN